MQLVKSALREQRMTSKSKKIKKSQEHDPTPHKQGKHRQNAPQKQPEQQPAELQEVHRVADECRQDSLAPETVHACCFLNGFLLYSRFTPELFIKDVRLLTDKQTKAPKGCAFVEFNNKDALQIALNYDGRTLGERRIRVELTAGGGGKSKNRMEKIKKKNADLRKRRASANYADLKKKKIMQEETDGSTQSPTFDTPRKKRPAKMCLEGKQKRRK
ncbi:RNA recognition motif-containing protein [Cyclospora cayetanensis]|uniref:RNA recognition motif-containing protein n=1 Tax=Cyclospora cayetanensis TaxID=88456 RepID=A0A1D3CYC9_9EIME|nr:RNA recognition motif-containing protein [Cyclospora cayetanensis]